MGWESRGQSGRYLYIKRRQPDGRVRSQYIGSGKTAELFASRREQERTESFRLRQAWQAERQAHQQLEAEVANHARRIKALAAEVLSALGYHRHKRQWRLRLTSKKEMDPMLPFAAARLSSSSSDLKEAAVLLSRSELDLDGHRQLHDILEKDPSLLDVFGIGALLRVRIVQEIGQGDSLRATIMHEVGNLERSLEGENCSGLERALINAAVIAWLQWQNTTWQYEKFAAHDTDVRRLLYWEKRMSAALKRYLQALTALATVRRLLARSPIAVQVNVAEQQQINVGAG